jgi:uncharacterized protein (TIGR03067 family)
LVLCEAYSESQVPETRNVLAHAVRRSFMGLGIRGKDDAEFVANAIEWYKTEKAGLVVNSKYPTNELRGFGAETLEACPELYEQAPQGREIYPLFDRRPIPSERPGPDARPREASNNSSRAVAASKKQADYQTAEDDLARLQGVWKPMEMTVDGTPAVRAVLKGYRFVIFKGTIVCIGPDGKKEWEGWIKLGSGQNAGEMDIAFRRVEELPGAEPSSLISELQEESYLAIYEFRGDSVLFCFSRPGAWRRPTSFEADEGSDRTLFTLKRVSTFGRNVTLGTLATVVIAALLFGPRWGLYWRWRRRAVARRQAPATGDRQESLTQ